MVEIMRHIILLFVMALRDDGHQSRFGILFFAVGLTSLSNFRKLV